MKRIVLAVIAALLVLVVAAPSVLAAPIGTCTITPASAPAGSTFTADCSGWGAGETLGIGWWVDQCPPGGPSVTVWRAGGPYVTDGNGNLTVSQVVPVDGQGHFHALPPQNYKKVPTQGFVGFYADFTVTP